MEPNLCEFKQRRIRPRSKRAAHKVLPVELLDGPRYRLYNRPGPSRRKFPLPLIDYGGCVKDINRLKLARPDGSIRKGAVDLAGVPGLWPRELGYRVWGLGDLRSRRGAWPVADQGLGFRV